MPLGSLFGLGSDTYYYISHILILFTTPFVITQLLNFAGSKGTIGGGDAEPGKRINSSLQASSGTAGKKKRGARQNLLLVCGPTHSGKTALFYHLLTKEVRTTVTSIEINETPSIMDVKIP